VMNGGEFKKLNQINDVRQGRLLVMSSGEFNKLNKINDIRPRPLICDKWWGI